MCLRAAEGWNAKSVKMLKTKLCSNQVIYVKQIVRADVLDAPVYRIIILVQENVQPCNFWEHVLIQAVLNFNASCRDLSHSVSTSRLSCTRL